MPLVVRFSRFKTIKIWRAGHSLMNNVELLERLVTKDCIAKM